MYPTLDRMFANIRGALANMKLAMFVDREEGFAQ